ncbi:hypothetical protein [Chryseobacterium sp. EO14]|uniref:hypothetical protein n=1 Tax=Chryseobacterium sp. EO14 TaxID=2950551 RepID=UPI00210A888A|nr:hypothetical protein [Chryseobacterium sp. EO14]MCQ4140493.1 hypothetical protein [Chryseobacterium sp. EO14]
MKRSSRKLVEKEKDITRLKQQLDEAVAKDGNEVRKLTSTEKETVLDDIFDDAELRQSIDPEGNKNPKKTRRSKKSKSGFDEVKELRKKNIERYENFLSKWSLKSIKDIPKYIIVEAIKGYTKHMDEVARLLEENKIHIYIEDEKTFNEIFELYASPEQLEKGVEGTTAFAVKNKMYFNENNYPDELLEFLSHEGSHAKDHILIKELISQGKSKKEIKEIIGNIWDQEERAYSHQIDWQKSTGQEPMFKTKIQQTQHIKDLYPLKK